MSLFRHATPEAMAELSARNRVLVWNAVSDGRPIDWESYIIAGGCTESDIRTFANYIDWTVVVMHWRMNMSMINEFIQYLDLSLLGRYQTLDEEFISKWRHHLNWKYVSYYQVMSEGFIRAHWQFVDWFYISRQQDISEAFIEEFRHLVDWVGISENHRMSRAFIYKYRDYLDWPNIISENHDTLTDDIIRDNADHFPWGFALSLLDIGPELMYEFSDRIHACRTIVQYNYELLKERREGYLQEIIQFIYHPRRVGRWINRGMDIEDM